MRLVFLLYVDTDPHGGCGSLVGYDFGLFSRVAGLKRHKLSGAGNCLDTVVLSRQNCSKYIQQIKKVWNLEIIKQKLVVEGRRRNPTKVYNNDIWV